MPPLLEVSVSHTIKAQTLAVGLLWTSFQFVSEVTSTYTSRTHDRNIHALSGIRARDHSNRVAADVALPGSSLAITLFFMSRQSLLSQGLLIIEASQSHSDTSHFVVLFWTSDQPDAEPSTWQQPTVARDRYPCPWRDSNLQSQQGSGGIPTP